MRTFSITPRMSRRIASALLLVSLAACTPDGDKPGIISTDNMAQNDADNFCDHNHGKSSAIASDDLYANFEELQTAEPNAFSIITRDINNGNTAQSLTLIFTPHGGGIEPGSTEIADAIADAPTGADYDYYSFSGIKSSNNGTLHITSTNFDEPTCETMVAASNRTIGIHGCSGNNSIVYVGGLDNTLRATVATALTDAGFTVSTTPPADLAGTSPNNICNRNSISMGVQLEISKGLRQQMMTSLNSASGRATTKTATFYTFVNAVRSAL
jgi:phage replication-related protein YjqB (UPF0714/DUF867 family)